MTNQINSSKVILTGHVAGTQDIGVTINVVSVPRDRIAVVLHERIKGTRASQVSIAWLGLAVSIWSAYFTATFNDTIGIKASVIESAFLLSGVVTALMTVYSGIRYVVTRKECSIDAIVTEIAQRAP